MIQSFTLKIEICIKLETSDEQKSQRHEQLSGKILYSKSKTKNDYCDSPENEKEVCRTV